MNNIWQLQNAKSKFSELVERTRQHGAQIITRHGKKVVVMLPFEEYQQLTRPRNSLTAFLLASPLAGSNLPLIRDKSLPRKIEIEP